MPYFDTVLSRCQTIELLDTSYCVCERLQTYLEHNEAVVNYVYLKKIKSDVEKTDISLCDVSKKSIISVWRSKEVSDETKFLLTFLWGVIKPANLSALLRDKSFSQKVATIIQEMEGILSFEGSDFYNKVADLYDKTIDTNNNKYHIDGVNTSFITKIFQFYFLSRRDSLKSGIIPVIADKWLLRAICADIISNGILNECKFIIAKNKDVKLCKHDRKSMGTSYAEFLQYINRRCDELSEQYPGLTPEILESILFYPSSINGVCPRCEATRIIDNYRI